MPDWQLELGHRLRPGRRPVSPAGTAIRSLRDSCCCSGTCQRCPKPCWVKPPGCTDGPGVRVDRCWRACPLTRPAWVYTPASLCWQWNRDSLCIPGQKNQQQYSRNDLNCSRAPNYEMWHPVSRKRSKVGRSKLQTRSIKNQQRRWRRRKQIPLYCSLNNGIWITFLSARKKQKNIEENYTKLSKKNMNPKIETKMVFSV